MHKDINAIHFAGESVNSDFWTGPRRESRHMLTKWKAKKKKTRSIDGEK